MKYFCNNLQYLLYEWLSRYRHQICTSLHHLQEKHHILLILEHYKVGFPFQGLDSEKKNELHWKLKLLQKKILFITKKKLNMKNHLHIHTYWKIKLLRTYSKLIELFLLWRTAQVVGTIKSISVWGKVHKPLNHRQ